MKILPIIIILVITVFFLIIFLIRNQKDKKAAIKAINAEEITSLEHDHEDY